MRDTRYPNKLRTDTPNPDRPMKSITITEDHPCFYAIRELAEQSDQYIGVFWTREDWNNCYTEDQINAADWKAIACDPFEWVAEKLSDGIQDHLSDIKDQKVGI